jgi:hypothetical protein
MSPAEEIIAERKPLKHFAIDGDGLAARPPIDVRENRIFAEGRQSRFNALNLTKGFFGCGSSCGPFQLAGNQQLEAGPHGTEGKTKISWRWEVE